MLRNEMNAFKRVLTAKAATYKQTKKLKGDFKFGTGEGVKTILSSYWLFELKTACCLIIIGILDGLDIWTGPLNISYGLIGAQYRNCYRSVV